MSEPVKQSHRDLLAAILKGGPEVHNAIVSGSADSGAQTSRALAEIAKFEESIRRERGTFLSQLEAMWHRTAGLISYHHADDSAKEWGLAKALFPLLLELERQIKSYGGKRPTGDYLISNRERIEWLAETTPIEGTKQ